MEACPKCNFSLAPGAQECPACGVILSKLRPSTSSTRVAPPPVMSPMSPMPAPPVAEPLEQNPYTPPTADVERPAPPPGLAIPSNQQTITFATLAALDEARPWLRFLVGYGFVALAITLIASIGLLVGAVEKPELIPLALLYMLYGVIGFAILMPLRRSVQAIRGLTMAAASVSLETFAIQQAQFWRRIGLLTAVTVVLVILAMVIAIGAGIAASG